MTVRIALELQYLGTHFYGWQRQSRHRSVQQALEEAIASRAHHPVVVHGAGRTDTGVHAAGQVGHFDTQSSIPPEHWRHVLNNCLPEDIAIRASTAVPPGWHARFSACWRQYRYLILNQQQPDVFWRLFSWHHRAPLDVKIMDYALQSIVGSHDLEAFRRSGSSRPHSWVTVEKVICQRVGNLISVDVRASGFLYRMMRLLVGSLAYVGRQELSPAGFEQLWQTKDWTSLRSRYSAPPQGLCLVGVGYPEDPFFETERLDRLTQPNPYLTNSPYASGALPGLTMSY